MWQEIDPAHDRLIGSIMYPSAAIAALFMVADLLVHPYGGISTNEYRHRLPLGGNVGNAIVSAIMVSGGVLAYESLRRTNNKYLTELGRQLPILSAAGMIVANVDIESATSNNQKEALLDASIGITTGLSYIGALLGLSSSNAGHWRIPPMVADTADQLFG